MPRRRLGVSQSQLADMAGVSLNWYELFETGRDNRRVSADFVERVARALELDFDDRVELFRLALPEGPAFNELRQRELTAAVTLLRAIPGFLRHIMNDGDLQKTVRIAASTMHDALKPDVVTIGTMRKDGTLTGTALGPHARFVSNSTYRVFWEAHAQLPAGHVAVVEYIPSAEELAQQPREVEVVAIGDGKSRTLAPWKWTPELHRQAARQLRLRSSLAVALWQGDTLRALLGSFWETPRRFSRVELESARGIASIIDLIFAK